MSRALLATLTAFALALSLFALPAHADDAAVATVEAAVDEASDIAAPAADVRTRGKGDQLRAAQQARAGKARAGQNAAAAQGAAAGNAAAGPQTLAPPAGKVSLRPKRKDATPETDAANAEGDLARDQARLRRQQRRQNAADTPEPEAPDADAGTLPPRRVPQQAEQYVAEVPQDAPPVRTWIPGRLTGGKWGEAPALPRKRMDPTAVKPGEEAGYLSPTERNQAQARLGMKRKQLTDADGKALNTNGRELYVIDTDGNLFVSNGAIRRGRDQFYHSSFLSGADVASAGWIEIKGGKVTHIDNMSGHYKPSAGQLDRAASHLVSQGVMSANVKPMYSPASIMRIPPPPVAGATPPPQ